MKIVVFGADHRVGALQGDRIVDLNAADGRIPANLAAFIETGAAGIEHARAAIAAGTHAQPASGVKLHAPWPRKRIVCAGGNYAAHSYGMAINRGTTGITLETQTAKIRSDGQWGFWKTLDAVAGPGDPVPYPAHASYFDYEGEVVVVLGKRGKNVKAGEIGDYVWGISLGNDWSIRDHDPSPVRPVSYNLAKNFDLSASLGPCIVVGELDPQNVDVVTKVNGQIRQSYNSKDMVFSFGELLEYLSRDFTFAPGDLIFGGTGAGTAQDSTKLGPDGSRPHDLFLSAGSTVEVSSPAIGALANAIV